MTNDMALLPAELRKRLSVEPQRGERILYIGRPSLKSTVLGQIPVLLFAIFWSSITLPFVMMAWGPLLGFQLPLKGTPPSGVTAWAIALFIIPFAIVGVALLASVPYSVWCARKTLHAVTSDRILSIGSGSLHTVESYAGRLINFVKRSDGRHGRGSLEIAYGVERDSEGSPRPVTTSWHGIPDVRRAEAAILDLMKRRRD